MKAVLLASLALLGIAIVTTSPSIQAQGDLAARARALHKQAPLIDGHNDYPWALREKDPGRDFASADITEPLPALMTDIPRLRRGGVGAQFWSVYVPSSMQGQQAVTATMEQIDIVHRMTRRWPETFQMALTTADAERAFKDGKIGSMIGMEGGHSIDNSLAALRMMYALGARYMTLTHSQNVPWADSATDKPVHNGLSRFGEEVVREMNRLGMLVDLSHVSDDTMRAALRVSRAPVIFSHSSARALVDVPRNVPDDVLRKLPENGGVVMVAFVASFVDPDVAKLVEPAYAQFQTLSRNLKTEAEREALYQKLIGRIRIPPVSIGKVADHIEHIRDTAGIDHVGIGADYDGNEYWPQGLSDVSGYPNLFAELIRRGWSDDALRKLAGENALRVLERAEAVAVDLQKTTPDRKSVV